MFFSFKAKRFALIIICIISVLIIAGFAVTAVKAKIEKMNSVKVPVIAYHSFIKDKALWDDETTSPAEFESDLIWLKDHGYQTIFADDIVSYLNGGADLPEKPVMITIDNSMYNCYYYAFALLKKYNMKATVSVVGSCTEFACEEANPNIISSYLDWDNIAEMKRSGLVSFANQSYALNKKDDREGILMKNGEDYDDYRHVLLSDIFKTQHLLEDNCDITPTVFTYPYGLSCKAGERLIKNSGFIASFVIGNKVNYIDKDDTDQTYNLSRINRSAFISTEDFMKKYDID